MSERQRATPGLSKMRAAAMHSQQKLHQAMRNQFVQRQQFLVSFGDRVSVCSSRNAGAGFQRGSGFANDLVFERFTRNFPQRDKSVDGIGKTPGPGGR